MNQELDKIAKFFNTDNVVSNDDMKLALEGVSSILKSFIETTSQINQDTKQKLDLIVSQVNQEHNRIISEVDSKTSNTEQNLLKELKQSIDEVNALKEQISSLELQNGIDGKDADEEVIIAKVLASLPIDKDLPEETTNSIATKLNKGTGILKASTIKGMDELVKHVASLPTSRGDSSNPISLLQSGSLVKSGASKINFTGATLTQLGDTTTVAVSGSGQSAIQPQDEGSNLGTSGTMDTINFVGAGVTATRSTNTVTVTIPGGGGSTPTGTGFRHITAGVEDGASKLVDTADINNSQVTLAKMADVATSTVFYRKTAATGVPEVQTLATLKTDLGLTGTNTGDQTITLTGGVTGSGTGSFATTVVTNANLTGPITSTGNATSIASQTGTGTKFVVDNTPTLITPVLGVATATSINKMAITAPATSSTLAVADGKTFTASNTLTLAGTDTQTFTFPNGSSTVMTLASADTVAGVKTFNDGSLKLTGATSGASTLKAPAIASTFVHTLPAATGTVHSSGSANDFGSFTAYFTQKANGNTGTAQTIDWGTSNKQTSTLTGNCTFTFTAPAGPASLILRLAQDATGSRTVTWPATVHWSGGTAPTLTTTASKIDIITFYWDGTTYFGNSTLNFTA